MSVQKKKASEAERGSGTETPYYEQEEETKGSEESCEEDESSDASTTEMFSDEEVQVDFEARAVSENDFHGIRRLLQQLFLKAHVDLSALTTLILSQSNIGSVIKTACDEEQMDVTDTKEENDDEEEEEEEALGITTVVDLLSKSPGMQLLRDYLLLQSSQHAPSSVHKQLSEMLSMGSKASIGLVVHERFLNIPSQIGPPLLNTLMHELQQHKSLKFSHLLFITRCHMTEPLKQAQSARKRKSKKAAVSQTPAVTSECVVYDYVEMNNLSQESSLLFSYPVAEQSDSVMAGNWSFDDVAMIPCRSMFVLSKDSFYRAVQSVTTE